MPSVVTFDFQQAKAKHLLFKSRLRSILYGEVPDEESTVLSQYACQVGKWIYSHALIQYESIPEVHELEKVHASIHTVARDLVKRYQAGNVAEARQGLSGMEQIADHLVELLQIVEEKVLAAQQNALPLADEPTPSEATILTSLLARNEELDAKIKDQVETEKQVSLKIENERQVLHDFFMQAPAAHCILRGPTHIFELANSGYIDLIGGRNVLGMTVRQALPELEGQGFYELLDGVYSTGEPFVGKELLIFLDNGQGQQKSAYLNFIYQPIKNSQGKSEGILVFAYEVTEQVIARKSIEASEAKLQSIITTAPAAMGLFVGRDLIVDLPNQAFIDIVGKGPDIVGKPLREVMPELESQVFLQILDDVYTSGKMFQSFGSQVDIVQQGIMTHNFYNITYTPLLDADGNVYAILDIAIDVTKEVLAKQQIAEAEERLRGAVELAELGTWEIDLTTGILDYSERLRDWCGFEENEIITIARAYSPIREADRPLVKASMLDAITPGTSGIYDVEYTVRAGLTGRERILHAQGKAYFDDLSQAYKVSGTVQDVTEQRKAQLALEQQVRQRTEELALTNEELASINEELATINEELAEANGGLAETNQLLTRSNEDLEQFAYIASHDLQEPLRKIQLFSNLLQERYSDALGEHGNGILNRMSSAGSRMSLLIRDLLTFSRISTRQVLSRPVSLADVVNQVQDTLAVLIDETNAQIHLETLPIVQGDASQLDQLFQNLLANALKFRRTDSAGLVMTPQIKIRARQVLAANLPSSINPTRQAIAYHCIEVTDNGIGFDEKYTNRIFQVFQRLHGKNEFAGTGVGLAICQKVVANHGGAITATSQPGQGATFSVYLPA